MGANRISWATALLALVVGLIVLAPVVMPFDPDTMDFARAMRPPSWDAPFGTDTFGRGYLARTLYAGRPALAIAGAVTVLAFVVGVPLGVACGYAGGALDLVAMRVLEVGFAIPPLVLAIAIVGLVGPSTWSLVGALAAVYAPLFARVARGAALARTCELYVTASRAAGMAPAAIVLRQILPNIGGTLVTQGALVFSYALLAEASLSFLGLGTQAADPSWGRLLTEAIPLTTVAPWLGIFPGAAIVLVVTLLNLRADAWGDALDPRLTTERQA